MITKREPSALRDILWLVAIVSAALCFSKAYAQSNSRNWVNLSQQMTGGTNSTLTTTAFSAFNSLWPFKYYSLAVSSQITNTVWTVNLDGSNDLISWTTLVTNKSTTNLGGSGGVAFQSSAEPVLYLRLSPTQIGSGNIITATAIGVP